MPVLRDPSSTPTSRLASAVAAGLALLLLGGCGTASDSSGPTETAETVTSSGPEKPRKSQKSGAPVETAGPSASVRPDQAPDPLAGRPGARVKTTLVAAVAALPVAPERRTGYDRDLFAHWSDADRNGCDTRDEVLITQNRAPGARLAAGCTVVAGEWFSYYDQLTTTSASSFDIDHLVPLAEAWDSGAHAWSAPRREAFANDLGDRRALIAVSASSNRTKSDADPAQWMPAYKACVYVSSWVAVKVRWRLSVDPAEQQVLARYAASCGKRPLTVRLAKLRGSAVADARSSDAGQLAPATPATPATPSPPAAGTSGGGAGLDPRFDYCTSAVAAGHGPYVRGRDPEYAWYRDGDGDGTVCES
ncbi:MULTISPECIES: GmrSD restriction endonuclease domain-containing protein [unclassified Nocardioides]|uniref:GmrSD restriction endonuclease domain-containing protein n=1 Tax=unclassified Nocardioides TaxID=2615069 RepID=UPI001E5F82B9|nr:MULTISPECIES: DUF1524 domain-containing protein [unclassified Nocardioides]